MRSFRQSRLTWCLVFLLGLGMVVLLSGCDSDDDDIPEHEHEAVLPDHDHEPEPPIPPTVDRADVVRSNAVIAYEGYRAAWEGMKHFQEDLMYMRMYPNAELGHMQDEWRAARETYQPTEIYRFREGPIDTLACTYTGTGEDAPYRCEIGQDGDGPELRVNGWPLGEAFIDYVYPGDTDGDETIGERPSGSVDPMPNIIADVTSVPNITKQVLKTHLAVMTGDERDVATGYHAIEFLLWGQDLNYHDAKMAEWGSGFAEGYYPSAGHRDWTDGRYGRPSSDFYHSDTDADGEPIGGPCTSGPTEHADRTICERRMAYLEAATQLLIDDLKSLVDAWAPPDSDYYTAGNYYDSFTNPANTDQSLAKILEGMGRMAFGELAGERITIAVLTQDQEEEHSCFSDNTHRDIYLNVVGVQNMFLGDYNPLETQDYAEHRLGIFTRSHFGPGIYDLLLSAAPDVAQGLMDAIGLALAEAGEIDALAKGAKPFDVQILENDPTDDVDTAVERIITALGDVRLQIEAAIVALELTTGDLRQDTCETVGGIPGTGEDCPQASS